MRKLYFSILFSCLSYAATALSTLGGGGTAAGTICVPATNAIIYSFAINQTVADANLNTVNFTTTGTYTTSDILNIKLWYNNVNNFGTATAIGLLTPAAAGVHSFVGLSALLSSTTSFGNSYFWITVDAPGTATPTDNIAVSSITSSNIAVSSGGTSGSSGAGSLQVFNPTPAPITSTTVFSMCTGGNTISLADATMPGTGLWSSSSPLIATINSVSGVVLSGSTAGTTTISYTIGGACTATTTVAVLSTVSPILPPLSIGLCQDSTRTLTDPLPGGTWTSGATGIATVNSSTGAVSGVYTGGLTTNTATITYSVPGCTTPATTVVTVYPLPLPITGPTSVCAFAQNSITLSDATTGGIWSSVNVTVGGTTGIVQGAFAGTVNPVYYTDVNGCSAMANITVNAWPASITGHDTLCGGGIDSTLMTDASGGGLWSTSNPLVATIGSSSGEMIGIGAGSAFITYTNTTTSCYNTQAVYVFPFGPIVDVHSLCVGSTFTFSDTTHPGFWTSNNSAIATVNNTTGLVTGISAGLDTINYTIPLTGCHAWDTVRIYPLPAPISPLTFNVCAGSSFSLSDATTGGTWSSAHNSIATVVAGVGTTGIVTGVAAGTDSIIYTLSTGCAVVAIATVNPVPNPVSGANTVCVGSNVTLTESTSGGTWSVTNANATISPSGAFSATVHGVAQGIDTVVYTLTATGCASYFIITINPLPGAITGTLNICALSSTTLSDPTTGGTWLSVHTSIATVVPGLGFTGVVTGVAAGTDSIIYTLSTTNCSVAAVVTVNAVPFPISGTLTICSYDSTLLSDLTPGGHWTSGNIPVATVGYSTGKVFGVSGGVAPISYSDGTSGCSTVVNVTVNAAPAAITGASFNVCFGNTITLSDATTTGSWSSNNTSIATVSSSGVVTGVSATTAATTITYTLPSGCYVTHGVTVNALPLGITGTTTTCVGSSTTLSDATTGGFWTSSNPPIASVGALTGIVSGVTAGVVTITYTSVTGCNAFTTVTVYALPPAPTALTGSLTICSGDPSLTLTDSISGGTWSSTDITKATIDPVSGAVNPIDSSHATIRYTVSTGCSSTVVVSINLTPASITGPSNICLGSATAFNEINTGGTWFAFSGSSAPFGSATITSITGTTANVHADVAGNIKLLYNMPWGCPSIKDVFIDPTPSAIYGPDSVVCVGNFITLIDSSLGGTWSANNGNATVSGGVVTGVNQGLDTIIYSYPASSCSVSINVTVNPLAQITGVFTVCQGLTTTLSDTTLPGGTWSSSDGTIATVSAGGVVAGVAQGVVTITFTVTVTGCQAYASVTVNGVPAAITGGNTVCIGSTLGLSDATPGISWSSSSPGIATIDPIFGIVTGVALGTDIITCSINTTGCYTTEIITVNAAPPAISGPTEICIGAPTVYSDASGGGTWSTTSASWTGSPIISIVTATGIATGNVAGVDTIIYTLPSGCVTTLAVTVNVMDSIMPSFPSVCVGSTIALTDATPGGTWTSLNTSIASIDPVTGIATGLNSGTVTIDYSLTSGCTALRSLIVNPNTPIIGHDSVCLYETRVLTDATTGGIWSCTPLSIITISSGGIVTGVAVGTGTVYYTNPYGCTTSVPFAVTTIAPITSAILSHSVCSDSTLTLVDTASGGLGTWSSSFTSIATVTGGVVTGVSAGTVTITYASDTTAYTSGCIALYTVTVNPSPNPIISVGSLCAWGGTITVYDSTLGGIWSSTVVNVIPPISTSIPPVAYGTIIASGTGTTSGPGIGTIIYTLPTGCKATKTVTINPLPNPIAGPSQICVGLNYLYTDGMAGGTWSVGTATAIATVNPASGSVTGITAGVFTLTYTMPTGCTATKVVTVNPNAPIVGPNQICVGQPIVFTDAIHGGTWSIAPVTVASISPTGFDTAINVTGITAPGPAILLYTLPSGCVSSMTLTVNGLPAAIGYTSNVVCATDSILVTNVTPGGTWSSTNHAVDTVDALGEVYGTGAGVDTIKYTLTATGCYTQLQVTVYPLGPILPVKDTNICLGVPTTLTDTAAGGFWTVSNTSIANITLFGGVITGTALGIDIVHYTMLTGIGCTKTLVVTVWPQPNPITGPNTVCAGSNITVSNTTFGGTWSSTNLTIASVSATGVVSGNVSVTTASIDTIVYTMPSGCFVIYPVTVYPLPAAITGPTTVCGTDSILLSDATPFGAWTVTSTAVVSLDPIGSNSTYVIGQPGVSGTAIVTYTIAPNACYQTYTVTVNPLSLISGPDHICFEVPTSFSDPTPGGIWSSTSSTVTVGSGTGIVTGVIVPGTATITYTIPSTGCATYYNITVNPVPAPIAGPSYVCVGQTVTLTDFTAGGTWTSHDPSRATIGSTTGVVTGINTGTVIITYAFGTGCFVVRTIIVNPLSPITGSNNVCFGDTIHVADSTPGGVWSSSSSAIASVNPIATFPEYTASVLGTGAIGGTATISYTLSTGCVATFTVTVFPLPAPIGPVNHICDYSSITMTDATPGGIWSSYPTGHVTITNPGGLLTAIDTGTITLYYTLPTGCKVSKIFSVFPIPDSITGLFNICLGSSTSLSDLSYGGMPYLGSWFSANPGIANIGVHTGYVTGLSVGTTVITYMLPQGCYTTELFRVDSNVTPTIDMFASTGDTICPGQIPNFTTTITGGGFTPIYEWYINTILQVGATGPTFTPSSITTGDIIKVTLVSSASCAVPTSVSNSLIMTVQTAYTDSIRITSSSAATQDTVCMGTPVTYTATAYNGGGTPVFIWLVNGAVVQTGPSNVYSYIPSFFDQVSCRLVSSLPCAAPDSVLSNVINMYVRPGLVASISIYAVPGTIVRYFEPVIFYSESVNFGANPLYQWYLNSVPVPGATNSTYTLDTPQNGDLITCKMWSSNPCTTPIPAISNVVKLTISNVEVPYVANGFNDVALIPNPNKGTFRLKGSLNSVASDEVVVEITDILGKVVYKNATMSRNGNVDMEVKLDENIVNGIYYLRMTAGGESDVRHFVIE